MPDGISRGSSSTAPTRPGRSGWLPTSSSVPVIVDRREARNASFTLAPAGGEQAQLGDAERRLTRVYHDASRGDAPMQTGFSGPVSRVSSYGSALGAAAYRYLSGSGSATPGEIRPPGSPLGYTGHAARRCSPLTKIDELPVTPTRSPPATPDLSCTSLSASSPFEWSDLHRHPRYASSSSSTRFSQISYTSYNSTLSSITSFGPTTPQTPTGLALTPPPWQEDDIPSKRISDLPLADSILAARTSGLGLGLTFDDSQQENEDNDSFDPDDYARAMGRLDSMLVQIQTMTQAAEAALSASSTVIQPRPPCRTRSF